MSLSAGGGGVAPEHKLALKVVIVWKHRHWKPNLLREETLSGDLAHVQADGRALGLLKHSAALHQDPLLEAGSSARMPQSAAECRGPAVRLQVVWRPVHLGGAHEPVEPQDC
eukprot:CAMPEP_0117648722 /NCGR_PEP_ID=MMETSP0804-20121206/568_1 /TAXON_ID=1074897 /ORGANISM="Tetraselmis astigmatica, Strain CCMP880" /LENGTH=111 /DNA_ID=CAMNT_0005454367 /DNA_START=881 /DNA_END=1213 /DNA_ORIENTATION=-